MKIFWTIWCALGSVSSFLAVGRLPDDNYSFLLCLGLGVAAGACALRILTTWTGDKYV